MNNKNLLLKVLEAGRSKIKVPADSVSGEDPLPGSRARACVCVCVCVCVVPADSVSGEDPLPGSRACACVCGWECGERRRCVSGW